MQCSFLNIWPTLAEYGKGKNARGLNSYFCSLMKKDRLMEIHQALKNKGLEMDFVSTNCPFGADFKKAKGECPYYE